MAPVRRPMMAHPHGKVHLCHVANTIEPSICSGDAAALYEITLTACFCCDILLLGLLRLRTRKVILKHLHNLTRKMSMYPMLKVPADADKA